MPAFVSQHTSAEIDGAISAIIGDTASPNGTTIVTSISGSEYVALWDAGTPKTITYANFVADIALESGLLEGVDDRVAALLTEGSNITLTYDDGADTLTISVDAIDNTVIGGVTPAAGTFTTLSAGATTVSSGLTLSAGDLEVSAGAITVGAFDATASHRLQFSDSGGIEWHISYTGGGLNFLEQGIGDSRLKLVDGGGLQIASGDLTLSSGSLSVTDAANRIVEIVQSQSNSNAELFFADGVGDRYRIGTTGSGADLRIRDEQNARSVMEYDASANETLIGFNGGLVGIGTSSPDAILTVNTIDTNRYVKFRAPNSEERFNFYTGGTGNPARLDMYEADGTTRGLQLAAGGTSYINGGPLLIGTTSVGPNSEKLFVDSVSSGITANFNSAATQRTLVLETDSPVGKQLVLVDSGSSGYAATMIGSSSNSIEFYTGSSGLETMRLTSGGALLIGTTSATSHQNEVLRVSGTAGARLANIHRGDSGAAWLHFTNTTTGTTTNDGFNIGIESDESAVIKNDESTPMRFYTASTERFRVAEDAYALGIGTTDVEAWSASYTAIELGDGGAIMAGRAVSRGEMYLMGNAYYDGSYKYKNTNEASQFIIYDGYFIWDTAASGTADATLTWSEKMRLTNDGALLIGTTSASGSELFKVDGDAVITGDLAVSGTITGSIASSQISDKALANGVASLDGSGKVPSAQLPALALTDVFVVASQSAQLALTAQEGDLVIRTDESKTYVHNGGTAGTMADYTELQFPDAVTSVNSLTGTVVLDTDDVSEGSTNLYYTDVRADARISAAVLDDLSDVTETSITTGDVLRWSGTEWVNYADSNYAAASHTHTSSDVTDFAESVDDQVATLLVGGTNVSLSYDDGAGTLTINSSAAAGPLNDVSDVTITSASTGDLLRYNGSAWVNYADSAYAAASHTHTVSNITDFGEGVDDQVATLLTAGDNITLTYDDGAGTLTLDATGGGGFNPVANALFAGY